MFEFEFIYIYIFLFIDIQFLIYCSLLLGYLPIITIITMIIKLNIAETCRYGHFSDFSFESFILVFLCSPLYMHRFDSDKQITVYL